MRFNIRSLFLILFILFSLESRAIKTSGRITLGVAMSTERFSSTDFGSDKNDSLFSSQRFFYKVSEMGQDKWEFVSDFRNKYDSFGSLNKTQYQLDPKDEFHVRQLSLRMQNPEGQFTPIIGRFQVPEAGSVFVDGANLQYRLSSDWYSGLFAGLNPKQIDKSYLISDSQASQAGAFLTYQQKTDGWDTNQYLTNGFVQQKYYTETERQFLFQNAVYQWDVDSRVSSILYLDFVPKTYVQTMNLMYQQKIDFRTRADVGFLAIDVIEYQRRQNVLEKLDPSPYKETHAGVEYRMTRDSDLDVSITTGVRSSDQLSRTDLTLGYRIQNFITKNWDTHLRFTNRKNFTSQDNLIAWSLGYFSKEFEAVLDADYAIQKNDSGTTTHPMNTELSLTTFVSKELFATAAIQRAADETVNILGTFLKIGYRFGNQELPPIRDGAAPRGSL